MTNKLAIEEARTAVLAYLKAMEDRHLDEARSHIAPDVVMVFPGGRKFTSIDEIVANSGGRYVKVQKAISRSESWRLGDRIIVLVTGTLYGHWKDGQAFDGIRFADRFEVEDGKIILQEVWNDAGEHRLAGAGTGLCPATEDTQ